MVVSLASRAWYDPLVEQLRTAARPASGLQGRGRLDALARTGHGFD